MKHQSHLTIFQPASPSKFLAVDILDAFPRTNIGNKFIAISINRYSKPTRAISTTKTTASNFVKTLFENWINPYSIPLFSLTDNGPQFVGKLIQNVCFDLSVEHLTTIAYDLRRNGQVERYKTALITRLHHYLLDHQKNWDKLVQQLTFAYGTRLHR